MKEHETGGAGGAWGTGRGRGRDAFDIAVCYKDAIVGKRAQRVQVIHVIMSHHNVVTAPDVPCSVSPFFTFVLDSLPPPHKLPVTMSTGPVAFKRRAKPSTRKREVDSDTDGATEVPSETADESPITLATKLKKRAKPKSRLSFGAEEEVRL